MTMNRRTLLKSVGATALIPSIGIIRPKPMRAASVEMGWATRFPGDSYLFHSGNIPGMPTSPSYTGTLLFKYRAPSPNSQNSVFFIGNYFTVGNCPAPSRAANVILGDVGGGFGLHLFLAGPHPGAVCNAQNYFNASVSNAPRDNSWHDVIISWDGQNGVAKVMINAVSRSVSTSYSNGRDVATDFTGMCSIGGPPFNYYAGDFTDIGLFAGGPFIEPASIVGQLYDFEGGVSLRNSASGNSIVNGSVPQVWLSGPPNSFWKNGGTWTWPGRRGNAGGDFTVVGTLQNSNLPDPFEPNSPL